ncbi:MAG: rhomboid family intramembrane serine protease, partial [Candidatus Sumerlaeia bacterium]|nr:rhomboid family intramembrane serine protease [Candidatus Sumerlaeia bacterium]
MFIPYASDQVFYRRPWATYSIIAINLIVVLYEKTLSLRGFHDFLGDFAFVPSEFSPIKLVTSLFIHSGLIHFIGNMWFFALVAPVIEDRLGPVKFLLTYFGGGIVGNLAQALFIPAGVE